jgi:hypothetical protein
MQSASGQGVAKLTLYNLDSGPVELPAWNALVSFAGLIVSAPQSILDECAHVCRELSIRAAGASNTGYDKALSERLKANSRIRQFSTSLRG